MKCLIFLLLLASSAYAYEDDTQLHIQPYKVDTELTCYQEKDEVFCRIDDALVKEPAPKPKETPKTYTEHYHVIPKAVIPMVVVPVVRYIVIKVGESLAVDLAKELIIAQYKEMFPKKKVPTKITMQKAH